MTARKVEESFDKYCFEFGFKMDTGEVIEALYPSASYDEGLLKSVIDEIDDIDLLGSAVFSRWRYYMHWAMGGETILNAREWFITVLERMVYLTNQENIKGAEEKKTMVKAIRGDITKIDDAEAELLASCYYNSLKVAVENGIRSVAFPSSLREFMVIPLKRWLKWP